MHTPSRRRFVGAALSAVIASATLPLPIRHAQAADPTHTHLVLGATAGYNYDVLKKAVVPQLEKDGYTVKLIEFNDYIQPNLALAEGSLDANLFQHITYLKRFAEDRKLDLVALVPSTTAPMGIYSERVGKFSDVKEGDSVTLPNDPANLARALQLLAQQGLITLKGGIDPLRVGTRDVAENPRKLRFVPVEAAQLPRTVGDATLAIVPGNYATAAGPGPEEGLPFRGLPPGPGPALPGLCPPRGPLTFPSFSPAGRNGRPVPTLGPWSFLAGNDHPAHRAACQLL